LANAQAQARTEGIQILAMLNTLKGSKYFDSVFFFDADALISDSDLQHGPFLIDVALHCDLTVACELVCIEKEVKEYLAEPIFV
jgi:hypothetical protein